MLFKKKVMIDLDGVLNNYESFDPNIIPAIKIGAKEFIQELYNFNEYELVLFTTRNKLLASKWLIENGIDKYFTDITNIKEPAYLYLDDRAIQFNGDFSDTLNRINEFQVYWKK